jgi:hypothetical protein
MEPECLLFSQVSATGSCPESVESNIVTPYFLHLCLGLASGLFPSGFQTKIMYAFVSHVCCRSRHVILHHLVTLIIFHKKHKLEGHYARFSTHTLT